MTLETKSDCGDNSSLMAGLFALSHLGYYLHVAQAARAFDSALTA